MEMIDKTGHKIPHFEFHMFEESRWVSRTTDELFTNRKVILFAIPGAFTPICSTLHLPRYNELYETFRSYGIDEIYCLAVNDSFVLNAWKKAEHANNIMMLPDPDGEFSKRLGFLVNRNNICLGDRSWRYSMIVENGIIQKMFLEPEGKSSDPYGESSAENVLKYLNPDAELPPSVTIFSKPACPDCARIKFLLDSNHLSYEELRMNEEFTIKTAKALCGNANLPVVFINGTKFSDIKELETYLSARNSNSNYFYKDDPESLYR